MLVKGATLNHRQREQIKAAFVYRWTIENTQREAAYRGIGAPTIPLQSDSDWIAERAFYFVKDGSRLSLNRKYAEPAFLAD